MIYEVFCCLTFGKAESGSWRKIITLLNRESTKQLFEKKILLLQ